MEVGRQPWGCSLPPLHLIGGQGLLFDFGRCASRKLSPWSLRSYLSFPPISEWRARVADRWLGADSTWDLGICTEVLVLLQRVLPHWAILRTSTSLLFWVCTCISSCACVSGGKATLHQIVSFLSKSFVALCRCGSLWNPPLFYWFIWLPLAWCCTLLIPIVL